MKRWFPVIAVLLSLLWLGACTVESGGGGPVAEPGLRFGSMLSNQRTGLWVSGQGSASFKPDIAILTLGIEVRADSVATAQEKARQAMDKVKTAVTEMGVAEKDIQTTRFAIEPVIEWQETFPGKTRKEVITGYRVSHMVRVKVRDLDKVGGVIDAAAEAGGDFIRVRGVSFTAEDPTPYYSEARVKAVKDAEARAREIAQTLGIELGRPIYITESSSPIPAPMVAEFYAKAGGAPPPPTPISPGELEARVTVQIVYEIK